MRIDMELGSRSYPILVERGCLNRLGSLANLQRNILVVTDTGVPKPLVEAALAQCPQGHLITLPQGREAKAWPPLRPCLPGCWNWAFPARTGYWPWAAG